MNRLGKSTVLGAAAHQVSQTQSPSRPARFKIVLYLVCSQYSLKKSAAIERSTKRKRDVRLGGIVSKQSSRHTVLFVAEKLSKDDHGQTTSSAQFRFCTAGCQLNCSEHSRKHTAAVPTVCHAEPKQPLYFLRVLSKQRKVHF